MMAALTPRQRRSLWLRLGLFAVAVLVIVGVMHAPSDWRLSIVPLELSKSAAAFKEAVVKGWQEASTAPDGAPSFWRLRGNLFFDSVLFVPGYVSLLLFFTMALVPASGEHAIRRQLIGVPAVAAGLFDIAENGMTGRALDDLIDLALVDATVADVSLAARIKWVLLGLALALLAWRVAMSAAADKPWRVVAWVLCVLAALAFATGGALSSALAIHLGMAAATLGVGGLAWRALRKKPAFS